MSKYEKYKFDTLLEQVKNMIREKKTFKITKDIYIHLSKTA